MTTLLALCGLMLPATAQDVPAGARTPGKEAGASKMAQASAELTAQGADRPVTAERRADWPAQTGHTLLTVTLPDGGDVTLDRASRSREGLDGIGAGATLILPSGDVIGLSRDYPRAKHFAPDRIACPPE